MNLTLLFRSAVFAVVLLTSASAKDPPANDPDLAVAEDPSLWKDDGQFTPYAGDRFDAFDWRIFDQVSRSAGSSSNAVISPISIKVLLAMLYEGASGNTAKVLEQVLSVKERQEGRNRYSAVVDSLSEPNPQFKLNMATKGFIQDYFNVRSRYQKIIQYFYNADIEKVDFFDSHTAQQINQWIERTTENNIKNLVTPEDLKNVLMMLVNAVFFEGVWLKPFGKDDTGPAPFYPAPGQTYTTPFMSQIADFYYYNSSRLGAQILRMPYRGGKFSMFILLPNAVDGLDGLISSLSTDLVRQLMWNMTATGDVRVLLPRFDFDTRTDVKNILMALGVNDIFRETANFQGISSPNDGALFVSSIIQKALVEVNEVGTKAAAATQISLVNRIGTGGAVFNARHPFMFFIEDETTGTVLFVGKVVRPGKPPATLPTVPPTTSAGDDIDLTSRFGGDSAPTQPRRPAVESTNTADSEVVRPYPLPPRRPETTTPAPPVGRPAQTPYIWLWRQLFPGGNSLIPITQYSGTGGHQQYPQLVFFPIYAAKRK